ncbi:UNVERIFIED_CONTAM: hypothetical protein GTU68_012486 [Idotea baltica]|nr:hypothetical protein [Idotea baltica]
MKLAILGQMSDRTNLQLLREFFLFLRKKQIPYMVHSRYAAQLEPHYDDYSEDVAPFLLHTSEELETCDYAYSFGGDGTFLQSAVIVRDRLPLLGINFGRLGFLTSITETELLSATDELSRDMYRIDVRTGLMVETSVDGLFGDNNFGLNDLTIHKHKSNEMITVHTYLNGEFLNSYWGDGLIISTPTGSTAYSLACGGPIIHPQAPSFVITPVAPHSLTVRPMVIPDEYVISFSIESRTGAAMVALDTRTVLVDNKVDIAVRKADIQVKLMRVQSTNYLQTLRNKLMWGHDARNWKERMGS